MYTNSRRLLRTSSHAQWRGVLFVAIASLACPTLRASDVYRYVDAQGHVVYSDQAPPDSSALQSAAPLANSSAGEVEATQAPPALPDNEQPPCPEEGYLWTPGYWAWSAAGYYWVPGAWVQPPRVGVLWTPGYWGYVGAVYVFHRGYWAPHVGYYGGINYGFGYFGSGFAGGRWVGNSFAYNRAVSNVNERFHNTFNEAARGPLNRVSYHGGPGGTTFAATAEERAFASETHIPATSQQHQNMVQAAKIPLEASHVSVRVTPPGLSTDHRVAATTSNPAVYRAPPIAAARSVAVPSSVSRTPQNTRVSPPTAAPRPSTVTSTRTPTRSTSGKSLHPLH
jgi:hypothetical protein